MTVEVRQFIDYEALEPEVIEGIFKNPNITPGFVSQVLDLIPTKLPIKFLLGVAICPASSSDQLRAIFRKHKTRDFLTNLASNPAAPSDVLNAIFDIAMDGDSYLFGELLQNPAAPKDRLQPFLIEHPKSREAIFKRVCRSKFDRQPKSLWGDVAQNPSLTEAEQLAFINLSPCPEKLYQNKSLAVSVFDQLHSAELWRSNWFPLDYCSPEQIDAAALSWLERPDDNHYGELALSDDRCSQTLVLRGRQMGSSDAWRNLAVSVDWSALEGDQDMPHAVAERKDIPMALAEVITNRTIFEDPDDKYSVYADEAKWALAVNESLDPTLAYALYDRGIRDVVDNQVAPLELLYTAVSDPNLRGSETAAAWRNSQLTEQHLTELLGLASDSNTSESSTQDLQGFSLLQSRLRALGWYVERTDAIQGSHAWEDMPFEHQDGPFTGVAIDMDKVLISYIDDEQLQRLEEGSNEEGSGASNSQPQGEYFMYNDSSEAEDNLVSIKYIFDGCGCTLGEPEGDQVWIEWSEE